LVQRGQRVARMDTQAHDLWCHHFEEWNFCGQDRCLHVRCSWQELTNELKSFLKNSSPGLLVPIQGMQDIPL